MRAATATDIEDSGEIPVPFSISARTNVTMCKATKKKIVGGSNSKNSFLSVVDSLVMELNRDAFSRFHGSCSRIWLGRMRRGFHDRRNQVIDKKGGRPCEPPTVSVIYVTLLLAGTFAGCLCLLHPFRHFRFHCIKVETCAFLHRWVIEECLEFLAHHLLDEHKAPELEFKPIEVLLPAFFGPFAWPAHALKRIEAKVGDIRHVHMRLFTHPAIGLVDEAKLVIVNSHRADGAFAEVEDFVAL